MGLQVFENVPIQPRDAREASDVFYKQHQADVSLNYENEVILTNEMYGEDALPYVVPDNNVLVGVVSCNMGGIEANGVSSTSDVVDCDFSHCGWLLDAPASSGAPVAVSLHV